MSDTTGNPQPPLDDEMFQAPRNSFSAFMVGSSSIIDPMIEIDPWLQASDLQMSRSRAPANPFASSSSTTLLALTSYPFAKVPPMPMPNTVQPVSRSAPPRASPPRSESPSATGAPSSQVGADDELSDSQEPQAPEQVVVTPRQSRSTSRTTTASSRRCSAVRVPTTSASSRYYDFCREMILRSPIAAPRSLAVSISSGKTS